jgi:NTE family protein
MSEAGPGRGTSGRPRIGLALGSGGARGWAHIGVLRALARAGVQPDIIAGSSVGALVGGVYASGHLDTMEDWVRQLSAARLFTYLDPRMSGGGLIGGRRMATFMQRYFADTRVEDLPIPFVAVATDLLSGHELWLREGRLVDVLRTAISLPGIFTPVRQDGHWLVDGALVNPVPVSVCRALGARIVIAVNLNADQLGKARVLTRGLRRKEGFDPVSQMSEPDRRALRGRLGALWQHAFRRQRGAPSLFGVMVSAFMITQERMTRSRLAGDPPDLTVAPRLGHVGLLEFERAAEAIAEGEAAVERVLAEIRSALDLLA